MIDQHCLYRLLGLESNATQKEIHDAWRTLRSQLHPDKGGDAEVFAEVKAAYEVLSDGASRKRYDETGKTDAPQSIERQSIEQLMNLYADQLNSCNYAESPFPGYDSRIKDVIHRNREIFRNSKLLDEETLLNARRLLRHTRGERVRGLVLKKIENLEAQMEEYEKAHAVGEMMLKLMQENGIKEVETMFLGGSRVWKGL